jgi:hypothetical protein
VVRLFTDVPVKEVIGSRVQANKAGRINHIEIGSIYRENGNLFMKDIPSFWEVFQQLWDAP